MTLLLWNSAVDAFVELYFDAIGIQEFSTSFARKMSISDQVRFIIGRNIKIK